MPVAITEIIGRSEQGATLPFLCRGNDGALYYVKGRYAGYRTLCCEWIAGQLGRLLELPIPDFHIAEVPRILVEASGRTDVKDLGSGLVFASKYVEDAQEFTFSDVRRVNEALKQRILLFDWWIRNEDRTLTELGGNPNLLWSIKAQDLRVFDLNQAFDDTFDEVRFWQTHVFAESVTQWPKTFILEMSGLMNLAIKKLPGIWQSLPDEWLDSLNVNEFNLNNLHSLLDRFDKEPTEFWIIKK